MKKITVIPARLDQATFMPLDQPVKRKVAGYARVSTDSDEQKTSYEAQVRYYTNYIKSRDDWEFVNVYTDEGISGLGTRKREGFNEMVADALAGKIDLIVTKSVSRFARNTVDSLVTIRKLKEKGVEVYFEKENIYSMDGKGELLLTIMSSLAQEESRSISENVTWGQRKRFSDGKVSLPYKQFLGYEKGPNKGDPPVVNPEQAKIVQRIYTRFMQGQTACGIAKELVADGVPTPSGKKNWRASTIESILSNEKYRGSALLQKEFTTDFLTKKRKVNEGEVPQYYIEHSHEAIIDPEEWDAVQEEFRRRKAIGKAYSGKSVLASKIVCADCGYWYGAKTWHSKDKYKTVVWQCNQKYDKSKPICKTPHVTEESVKERFLKVYNGLIENKKPYIDACKAAIETLTDTTELDNEIEKLLQEMDVVAGLINKSISENASAAQDQTEYNNRYNAYADRYEQAKSKYDELTAARDERIAKRNTIKRFLAELKKRNKLLTEFDNCLWLTVIDRVTVQRDGSLIFRFYNGTEISG